MSKKKWVLAVVLILFCVAVVLIGITLYQRFSSSDHDAIFSAISDYEKDALTRRAEKGEDVVTGDFDRDGKSNIDELKNGTNMLDPSDSHTSLKQESINFVDKLVEYHDSHNAGKTTPEVYTTAALKNAIDVVEARPQIAADITPFGADALPRILVDKNMGEILANPNYQMLIHAMAVQAQKYFYDIKNTLDWGSWKGPKTGMMMNGKLDPEEKQILDQRWGDRDVILADGESRIENIEHRVLNETWLYVDSGTGRKSTFYDPDNTDTWVQIANNNAAACPRVRGELSRVLDNTSQRDALIADLINYTGRYGKSGQKFSQYIQAVLKEGTESDKKLLGLMQYTRTVKPGEHEVCLAASELFASFDGKDIYCADGTIPESVSGFGGLKDGKAAPVFSEQAMTAIKRISTPTADKTTGAIPQVYGADEECLKADQVKYVKIAKDTGPVLLFGND